MAYDDNNIFAKILRGEIPCAKVYEDDHVLAFNDIAPQAESHVLVIPKGRYVSMADFSAKATDAEISALIRALGKIARDLDIETSGYRLIANAGPDSNQEVAHLHFHLLGGENLGPLLSRPA